MWLKIGILAIIVSFVSGEMLHAQGQYAYQVNFTDKNNTPYRLTSPEYFLSERSILRRFNQVIPIDSTDLPVNRTYVDSVLTITGGALHEVSKWQNLMVVLVTEGDTAGLGRRLQSTAFIKSYQVVGYYNPTLHHRHRSKFTTPGSRTSENQRTTSGDADYYGPSSTWNQTELINGNYLNDMGYKGAGMMISILDAGFVGTNSCPYGFDSLRNSGRIIDVHNFAYNNEFVYGYDNHGTEVLSTMAAYVPDTFVGSAPLAMYNLYVTENDSSEQPLELINLLCGAERADSVGTDVITCSLGYNTFDNPAYNFNFSTDFDGKTTVAARAVNTATQKGILCVITAGNEGTDGWHWLLTPGDADSALTIGATDDGGTIANFSGYGPNAAGQVKPDVCAQGVGTSVINGSVYSADNGTSFSTPTVAGFAACLWEANPTASPYRIRYMIDRCASMYYTPGVQYGYGLANFKCSLLSVPDTKNPGQSENWLTAYPNPVNNQLSLSLILNSLQAISFRLTDMTGQILWQLDKECYSGTEITINTQNLPGGIYFLEGISATQQSVIKVVKY